MEDEIFGPILPVVSYNKFNEAMEEIASRPHPLAAIYL
jgi:acyl-CoA reductase-like NAD-dependent aldehyde dehydrogenase